LTAGPLPIREAKLAAEAGVGNGTVEGHPQCGEQGFHPVVDEAVLAG
jgi:hypothetical protein